MSRSAAFALPVLHRFGVGFLVPRLREKELSRSRPMSEALRRFRLVSIAHATYDTIAHVHEFLAENYF